MTSLAQEFVPSVIARSKMLQGMMSQLMHTGEAALDTNFIGGQDQITYRVNVSRKRRPLTVTAELLYQSVSYPFVENLRQDNINLVNRFMGFYVKADKTPRIVTSIQKTVK